MASKRSKSRSKRLLAKLNNAFNPFETHHRIMEELAKEDNPSWHKINDVIFDELAKSLGFPENTSQHNGRRTLFILTTMPISFPKMVLIDLTVSPERIAAYKKNKRKKALLSMVKK